MDKHFMKKALKLAEKGKRSVDPNPMVGAVIVKNGRIIGEGYHQKFGQAHAEVQAFSNATEDVSGSTLYVTLEPCSHYGKTPPCASLIIEKKIAHVIIASIDPNPLVAGKGIAMLESAGIKVEVGLLDEENKALNKVFFKFITTNKPYVILKTAMTLDGKIATYTHQSKWITNDKSRMKVHQLRHNLMAIMVGVNTVIYDDPKLTSRVIKKVTRQPVRIILDTHLDMPLDRYIIKTAQTKQTLIFTKKTSDLMKQKQLIASGVELCFVKNIQDELDLNDVMTILAQKGISSILLEGGSMVNFACLSAGIVDEVHAYIAPKIIGGKEALTPVGGVGIANIDDAIILDLKSVKKIQGDVELIYKVMKEA